MKLDYIARKYKPVFVEITYIYHMYVAHCYVGPQHESHFEYQFVSLDHALA